MIPDNALPWQGPTCPQCGAELDVEPIATSADLRVGYSCEVHGLVSMVDPFDVD